MKKKNPVTNKKTLTKFLLLMLLSMMAGFFGAFAFDGILSLGASHGEFWEKLMTLAGRAIPITYVLMIGLVLGASYIYYFQARKMADTWDGEDEEVIDQIENKLGVAITLCNLFVVFNFFFFSATVEVANRPTGEFKMNISLMLFAAIAMLVGLAGNIALTALSVNLEKRLNPEKRGDVLEQKFNREWLASCDEAQQKAIFEAGYKAFKAGQMACMVMWIVTLFGQMFFNTGIFPVICVFGIYITLVLSYSINGMKADNKKSV